MKKAEENRIELGRGHFALASSRERIERRREERRQAAETAAVAKDVQDPQKLAKTIQSLSAGIDRLRADLAAAQQTIARIPPEVFWMDAAGLAASARKEINALVPADFLSLTPIAVGADVSDNFVRVNVAGGGCGCYLGPGGPTGATDEYMVYQRKKDVDGKEVYGFDWVRAHG